MPSPVMPQGWYLFWLGLAVGLTILAMSAYLTVSPAWLRWCLILGGVLVASRYLSMALVAINPNPPAQWVIARCWTATSLGLTFPGVVALDQLVRHPAMTPKKLLRWFSPLLIVYAAMLLFGRYQWVSGLSGEFRPELVGAWRWLLAGTQGLFVLGFCSLGILMMKKLPITRIRMALLGLMLAYGSLGIDAFLVSRGVGDSRHVLWSELIILLALWGSLETARRQAV